MRVDTQRMWRFFKNLCREVDPTLTFGCFLFITIGILWLFTSLPEAILTATIIFALVYITALIGFGAFYLYKFFKKVWDQS